jgi:hypothetical protein
VDVFTRGTIGAGGHEGLAIGTAVVVPRCGCGPRTGRRLLAIARLLAIVGQSAAYPDTGPLERGPGHHDQGERGEYGAQVA